MGLGSWRLTSGAGIRVTLWRIKQVLYALGMEVAAVERWRNLLDLAAAGRTMCWVVIQQEVLVGELSPTCPCTPAEPGVKGEPGAPRPSPALGL